MSTSSLIVFFTSRNFPVCHSVSPDENARRETGHFIFIQLSRG